MMSLVEEKTKGRNKATNINNGNMPADSKSEMVPPLPFKKPSKPRKKSQPANPDPLDESHINPRSPIHYYPLNSAAGLYKCKNSGNCKNEQGESIPDFIGGKTDVFNHAMRCWPNLRKKMFERTGVYLKENPDVNRKKSARNYNKEREKIVIARKKFKEGDEGAAPTVKCSFPDCEQLFFSPADLKAHIYATHERRNPDDPRSLRMFLSKNLGPCVPYEEREKNADLRIGLAEFIDNRRKTQINRAYLTLFLPPEITDETKAWSYLAENHRNAQCEIDYYAGKDGTSGSNFNVEKVHLDRDESTILNHIRETRKRAFQLVGLAQDSDADAAVQESIFQIMGEIAHSRTTPRPNSMQYNLINLRAELTNWETLKEQAGDDFAEAVDRGASKQPLLCLDSDCKVSHQVAGRRCFGLLHRDEVKLVKFGFYPFN